MNKLYNRKKQRLVDYDYSNNEYYFITICTNNRNKILSNIVNETVILTHLGIDVDNTLKNLSSILPQVDIIYYTIMPNHIHVVIALQNSKNFKKISLSDAVKSFKIRTRKIYNEKYGNGNLWQKSYYDRIIRNEKEYLEILKYIDENPLKWELDEYNS